MNCSIDSDSNIEPELQNGEDPGRGFVKAEDRVLAGRQFVAFK